MVSGIFPDDDALVRAPLGEGEGAVADEVFGAGPGAAEPGDNARVDGNPWPAGGVGEKARRRVFQGDDERVRVRGTKADRGKIRQFAGGEGAGVFHQEQERGLGRRRGGGEHALVRGEEISGGHGFAVGPKRIAPEVKRIGALVRGDFPALGGGGLGRGVVG